MRAAHGAAADEARAHAAAVEARRRGAARVWVESAACGGVPQGWMRKPDFKRCGAADVVAHQGHLKCVRCLFFFTAMQI